MLICFPLLQGEFQTQKEAAWAISNFTISGDRHQISRLIQEDVIPPFCNLLECKDPQVTQVVLDGIQNMLKATSFAEREALASKIEECGGLFSSISCSPITSSPVFSCTFLLFVK